MLQARDGAIAALDPTDLSRDPVGTITFPEVRIGIEAEGDPGGRMVSMDTLRRFCDPSSPGFSRIIVCASRTKGSVVDYIGGIANEFGYRVIWFSNLNEQQGNQVELNQLSAGLVTKTIDSLIAGRL